MSSTKVSKQPTTYQPLEMKWLKIDPEYQRDISTSSIRKATENFNPRGLRPITVSKRKDGLYYIIDGQHRFEIALVMGYDEYPCCEIHEGLTRAEEAELFVLLNNVKKVGPMAKFRADSVSGNKTSKSISSIVIKYGFIIGQRRKDRPNAISCVAMLKEIYEGWGKSVFEGMIRIIRSFFGSDSEITTRGMKDWFFKGIGMYLFDNETPVEKVIESLIDSEPEVISNIVFQDANADGEVSSKTMAYKLAIYIGKRVRQLKK